MRIAIITFCVFLITQGVVSAGENEDKSPAPWQLSLTGNYGTWESGDIDNNGKQDQVFGQIAYGTKLWGVAATGRVATTSYTTTLDDEELSFSTPTDVNIATYYAHEINKVKLRGGIDFDLPTGKSDYTTAELTKIITDPVSGDLMILNSYGAGLNIAPHFVAVFQLTKKASVGFGGRYTVTGEYDPTSDIEDGNLDPGDRLLALVNGAYQLTKTDIITVMAVYSHAEGDKMDGVESFIPGDAFILEARYMKQWDETFQSVMSLSYQTQDLNEISGEGGVLNSENQNSNNNFWETYVNVVYYHSKSFRFMGMLGYKSVDSNGYEFGDSYFDAGRERSFIEPGFMWLFTQRFYTTGKFRYSLVSDKKDIFSPVDADYDVLNVDLAIIWRF